MNTDMGTGVLVHFCFRRRKFKKTNQRVVVFCWSCVSLLQLTVGGAESPAPTSTDCWEKRQFLTLRSPQLSKNLRKKYSCRAKRLKMWEKVWLFVCAAVFAYPVVQASWRRSYWAATAEECWCHQQTEKERDCRTLVPVETEGGGRSQSQEEGGGRGQSQDEGETFLHDKYCPLKTSKPQKSETATTEYQGQKRTEICRQVRGKKS